MPKFFSDSTTFNYTWEQVAYAFWNRYPNPNSKHVLTEDIVHREVHDGKLFSKRLLTKTNTGISVPKWGERFISNKPVCIIEESIVDPANHIIISYTRNLGYTKILSVTEKVIYKESDDHPGKTVALRYGWIDSQVMGFSRAICAVGLERFKKSCNRMVTGFNYVLANLYPQTNTVPPNNTVKTSAKLKDAAKDAAKNASELAKSKAVPLYAKLHPNQS